MLLLDEHATLEEASLILLPHALDPTHWLSSEGGRTRAFPYQARVGKLRICASINVRPNLDVILHVAFRAPGLTPTRAVDHLEVFLGARLPLVPNTEWEVEIDGRQWIHFQRAYQTQKLIA